jgi:DNA-directed RNA polymerase subunit alpha
MIGLDLFKITKEQEDAKNGKYKIGPLPKGYGVTISNTLRRLLLSSIPGAAITAVKIDGVKHEYATMEGLQEDVLTMILKLKELSIKLHGDEKRIMKLEVKGKKGKVTEVSANDFDKPAEVEIINPEVVIAHLTSDITLSMEATVEPGVGYAYPNEELREELGLIPLDAIYSPVKKVQVELSKTRVGKETNYDQIDLTIITNGTVSPSQAMLKAAEIYDSIANRMVDLLGGDSDMLKEMTKVEEDLEPKEEKRILIGELNLSTRLSNALLNAGITNLNDLTRYRLDEVANFRGMGKKSLGELQEVLAANNLSLMD